MAATTILSHKAMRIAAPDLSAESINLLVRERGIIELSKIKCSRDEAKRVLFLAWLVRKRGLQADGTGAL